MLLALMTEQYSSGKVCNLQVSQREQNTCTHNCVLLFDKKGHTFLSTVDSQKGYILKAELSFVRQSWQSIDWFTLITFQMQSWGGKERKERQKTQDVGIWVQSPMGQCCV